MEKLARQYINLWNKKDLGSIRSIFSQTIKLIDWESNIKGLGNVIAANKTLFETVPTIEASIIDITCKQNKCYLELEIFINSESQFKVIDVIEVKDGKIDSINAYKQ